MAFIKFLNKDNCEKLNIVVVSPNIIRIISDDTPNINGFRLYLDKKMKHAMDDGEYLKYTTVYRCGDGWYELSNDGSVYVEPEKPEPPKVPTEEELTEAERNNRIIEITAQISALKIEISKWDYAANKTVEYEQLGLDAGYDWAAIHAERQPLRDRVNELETELAALLKE